jgi:Ca-activated chloride channel family protein
MKCFSSFSHAEMGVLKKTNGNIFEQHPAQLNPTKICLMRYLIFMLFFVLNHSHLSAQIRVDKTFYDFGDLYAHSERYVDFYFKNLGADKAFILRVEKQTNTVYQISSSTILPDSTVVLRIQVSEKKKGPFSIQVPVYLSDRNEALVLKLRGNIKESSPDLNSLTDCPSFDRRPSDGNPTDFMLTVVTVDKQNQKVLDKSRVEVIQLGRVVGDWRTDSEGKIQKKVPPGFTYFYASREGYKPNELGAYVNFKRNYIILELEREPETRLFKVEDREFKTLEPKEIERTQRSNYEPVEIEIVINNPEKPANTKVPKKKERKTSVSTVEQNSSLRDTLLTNPTVEQPKTQYYVPSNIVFVLDVSWSMNKEERLELMKLSLISLLEQVGPDDRVTVVTYGSSAEVIIPTTSGRKRDEIIDRVSRIKGGGMTAGGQGIKLGYNMAIRNQIIGGNNQIFVITDGAFNKDSQDYERTIIRNTKKGYVLSVVGIRSKPEDEEKMTEVARMGNGRFIAINSVSDARTKLYEELRRASYREE